LLRPALSFKKLQTTRKRKVGMKTVVGTEPDAIRYTQITQAVRDAGENTMSIKGNKGKVK
jgi:hypothetical protein